MRRAQRGDRGGTGGGGRSGRRCGPIEWWKERGDVKGIHGKLLDVDLTQGKTTDFPVPEDIFRQYLGGRGLGARLLYDLLPPKTDPLSPENLLIFLTGPLTGSMVTGSSKFVVVTKSPATHGWCDSYSSGRIAVHLKKVGYDGMGVGGGAKPPFFLA